MKPTVDAKMASGIDLEVRAPVAIVTLDWPERHNALDPEGARALAAAITDAAGDPDVCVVVLTGKGAFCTGGYAPALLQIVAEGPQAVGEAVYGSFQSVVRAIVAAPVPVIAAIDGAAVGSGMDFALACDERFIGPDGWMRQLWASAGLIPGTGGDYLLRRLAPAHSWSVIEAQERIDGERAEALGLGRACGDSALSSALASAARLAQFGRATLGGYCELSRAQMREGLEAHLEHCVRIQSKLAMSSRTREHFSGVTGRKAKANARDEGTS